MFKIIWEKRASQELEKLERSISSRIYKKVNELKEGFHSKDIKRLRGSDYFRLRIGDYRIIFSLEKDKLIIWKIGHRKKIYKK